MNDTVRVFRMLDISTGHITEDTCNKYEGFVLARYDFGVIFYLPTVIGGKITKLEVDQEKIPDDLLAVFNFAILNGCHYVKFDCDGTVYDDLTLYVW